MSHHYELIPSLIIMQNIHFGTEWSTIIKFSCGKHTARSSTKSNFDQKYRSSDNAQNTNIQQFYHVNSCQNVCNFGGKDLEWKTNCLLNKSILKYKPKTTYRVNNCNMLIYLVLAQTRK